MLDNYHLNQLAEPLLVWFLDHARVLPWRERPEPYRVWVSEIMLQQTRIEAAREYFNRFTRAFPTVEALAAAELDDVLKLWEGLGYYSRARNLHKCAKTVCETYGGVFPPDAAALRALPGIGDYTAGAIASIAYGLPEPAVDGNVLRVTFPAGTTFNINPSLLFEAYAAEYGEKVKRLRIVRTNIYSGNREFE